MNRKIDVTQCARCGQDHAGLEFSKFECKPEPYTHWASCPITGAPILMIAYRHACADPDVVMQVGFETRLLRMQRVSHENMNTEIGHAVDVKCVEKYTTLRGMMGNEGLMLDDIGDLWKVTAR